MNAITKLTLLLLSILLFTACKPPHHPKNPNYKIIKPKVIHTPSKRSLTKMVKKLQGSPYVWAEEGPRNFDCSGFTYYMYGSMGINIPRVARNQAKKGKRIAVEDLQYGDLIFFATNKRSKKITHVGMYLGDGWFTHASTVKYEVVYTNLLRSPYYKKRLRVCRRYLPENKRTVPAWKTDKSLQEKITPAKQPSKYGKKSYDKKAYDKKAIVIKSPMSDIEQHSNKGDFYVQVGSFTGKPKQALLKEIKKRGLHYKIIKFPKNGRSISKLLIGPYTSHSESSSVLERVQQNIQKDAFIAEIR
ncbi:MAG: NlpC/P60 family protein [Campylobacterota bacterium]|nr:NlpC/P60 family protein [Campylobacterota bacterium]